MSDAMECPESPEELLKKLESMAFENVWVHREGLQDYVKGCLTPTDEKKWEVQGAGGSFSRFSLKHVVAICPQMLKITVINAKKQTGDS